MERPSESEETMARDSGLGLVGALIYGAISPDLVDGWSDAEFALAKEVIPQILPLFENKEGSYVPIGLRLPSGFSEHYTRDVIPDMERVRSDPGEREWVRAGLLTILSRESEMSKLYRPGGATYSGLLATAAGDNRVPPYDGAEMGVEPISEVARASKIRRAINNGSGGDSKIVAAGREGFGFANQEITGNLPRNIPSQASLAYHRRKRKRSRKRKSQVVNPSTTGRRS